MQEDNTNSPDRGAFRTRLARFNYLDYKTPTVMPAATKSSNGLKSSKARPSTTNSKTAMRKNHGPTIPATTSDKENDPEAEGLSNSSPTLKRALSSTTTKTPPRKRVRKAVQALATSTPPARVKNNLVDSLSPGLTLIMVGVNPGLETARTGHAYAHPSNRYWPTMHESGVTPVRHRPSETHSLQALYGIGHTNIVTHPTRTEADITRQEYLDGARELDAKIRRFKPEVVAIVGKGIWLTWVEYKTGAKLGSSTGRKKLKELGLPDQFEYGWQDERLWIGRGDGDDGVDGSDGENKKRVVKDEGSWNGARTIVVSTTSGAAARFAGNGGAERLRLWRPLGEWFEPKREEWVRIKQEMAESDQRDDITGVANGVTEAEKSIKEETDVS